MELLLIAKVETIIELFFGVILIVFRKQIVHINDRYARIWMGRRKKQIRDEIEKSGEHRYFYIVQEIGYLIIGAILITLGSLELILPAAKEYVNFVLGFLILFIISAAIAGFCIFKIVNPILNRRLDRYMNDKYTTICLRLQSKSSSLAEKCEAKRSVEQLNDPIYKKLHERVKIYSIAWFVILTIALAFAFYASMKLTF